MALFPFSFNKPHKLSPMFLFNTFIFFFILGTVAVVNIHRYKNILNILENNLSRYQWYKKLNKKDFLISKIHIIDNNKIYTVQLFTNYKFSSQDPKFQAIDNEIKEINNYYKISHNNHNGFLNININNVVDKNHIEKINGIITKIFYNNIENKK